MENKNNTEITFSLQDIIDAVEYGRVYSVGNNPVPVGNILQWLMWKKNLLLVPEDWKRFKVK